MSIPNEPTFVVQPADGPIGPVVVRILVEAPDQTPEPIGTGVWIVGHMVLTARHNVECIIKRFGGPGPDGAIQEYTIRLYQVLPSRDYAIWEVRRVWCSPGSDLALLHVGLWGYTAEAPPNPAYGLRMSVAQPKIGDRVAAFGFHSITTASSRNSDGTLHLDLDGVPQATSGVVTDIHPTGRDSAMYPFPCFAVNARFDAGMSGGPVFDEEGCLIGIICGSLPGDETSPHVSYVATLAPLFSMQIDAKVKDQPVSAAAYPVADLVRAGVLSVVGF